MAKDKKPNSHSYVTRSKTMEKDEEYNNHESSSSDEEEWETEEEEEFDPKEYQKMLLEMFPSKFLKGSLVILTRLKTLRMTKITHPKRNLRITPRNKLKRRIRTRNRIIRMIKRIQNPKKSRRKN